MPAPEPPKFSGPIPEFYPRIMGPLFFEPCAADLVARLNLRPGVRVLELACGTGIVTRRLLAALPPGASLTATDVNDEMLAVARRHVGADPRVKFQTVDACNPPFDDASFDLILCQFGVMFFSDKPGAMRHARRILAPHGRYLFSVWDSLAHNPMPRTRHETLTRLFPKDTPPFLTMPFGFHDRAEIERLMRDAGFKDVVCDTVTLPCECPSAEDVAMGMVDGSPVAADLRARGITDTAPVRRAVAEALAERFGSRPCRATMQEIVVSAA